MWGKACNNAAEDMDSSNRRSHSVGALLVGLVLLIGLGVSFAAFVPVFTCDYCSGQALGKEIQYLKPTTDSGQATKITISRYFAWYKSPCPRCNDRGRVTLLKKWMGGENLKRGIEIVPISVK